MHKSRFFNVFSVVLGILAVLAIGLFLYSRLPGRSAPDASDPQLAQDVNERLKPFGEVAIAGQDNSALVGEAPDAAPQARPAAGEPAVAAPAPAAGPVTTAAAADGEGTYKAACSVCHGMGIAGAPKPGDTANWAPRIAQGAATLNRHAVDGYQGSAGVMPPKGGRLDLSDDAVVAAVEYMVANSR